MQVPIDTLNDKPIGTLSALMADNFRSALRWHMDQHKTKIADLARETGVSRHVINKLLADDRPTSSTTAERAMLIAAFYGKNVNQFVACSDVTPGDRLRTLADLLEPEELRLLEAQIRGLISQRAS